jgi:hypothetical protein
MLLYTGILEIRDMLAHLPKPADHIDSNMKVSPLLLIVLYMALLTSLQTVIRAHSRMLLFSADLTVYRGNSVSGSPAAMVLVYRLHALQSFSDL